MKRSLLLVQFFVLFASPCYAELVFHFKNPEFGGNASNGSIFMNSATAQNPFKAPVVVATPTNPITTFKNTLQSSILRNIQTTSMASLFDKNGNIILGSYLNFDLNNDGESDLTVQVDTAPIDGNINMTIFDGISSTVLTVPYTKN